MLSYDTFRVPAIQYILASRLPIKAYITKYLMMPPAICSFLIFCNRRRRYDKALCLPCIAAFTVSLAVPGALTNCVEDTLPEFPRASFGYKYSFLTLTGRGIVKHSFRTFFCLMQEIIASNRIPVFPADMVPSGAGIPFLGRDDAIADSCTCEMLPWHYKEAALRDI